MYHHYSLALSLSVPNQHVVSPATYIANTTHVVKNSRGGGLPSDNGDSQTGSVQQFQCQLYASNDDLSVEELCLSEDEETLLSATIAVRENTFPKNLEIHSGMEQNDDGSVNQPQLLITVVCCILVVIDSCYNDCYSL